ncbi:hypothetical protein KR067_005449 [Drosophila pandora]|nr:hypothetical protein KR067_005449 [Drosophila pandora]
MEKNSKSTGKSGGSALKKKPVQEGNGLDAESFQAIDERLAALLARVNVLESNLAELSDIIDPQADPEADSGAWSIEGSDFELEDDSVESTETLKTLDDTRDVDTKDVDSKDLDTKDVDTKDVVELNRMDD